MHCDFRVVRQIRCAEKYAWRLAFAALITAPVAGCVPETGGAFGFVSEKSAAEAQGKPVRAAAKPAGPEPLKRAELANGKIIVQGPRGYCVDPGSLKKGFGGGFALIAACNSLRGELAGADVAPVVMTVQVQPGFFKREMPTAAELATALAPAKVLRKVDGDGITLVQLAEGGNGGLPAGDPRHWRGTMLINGYFVGLALYAPKGSAQAGLGGKRLILALAENLRTASPKPK